MTSPPAPQPSGVTAWATRNLTPLRRFLRTETGSAAVLLAATVAALVWANAGPRSYGAVWGTDLSLHLGRWHLAQDLHGWVNSGLMTFFFLVVAVEARREFDMGELRQRSRLTLPLLAGIGGMIGPVAIYLALNAGQPSAHGWGTAMSTDTAFALGALALVEYAGQLGLDTARFAADMRSHAGAGHVAEDVDSADLSGVSGTPTFFVNGMRHYGAYDIDSLSAAVRAARFRAFLDGGGGRRRTSQPEPAGPPRDGGDA